MKSDAPQWIPWATPNEGPSHKFGYSSREENRYHPKRGVTYHSSEGYRNGDIGVIFGPRNASFQLEVFRNGETMQFYPIDADCWHGGDADGDGGVAANIELVGVEHEGVAGEPLTDRQYAASFRVYQWLAETRGWGAPVLYDRNAGREQWALATCFEHRWVSDNPTSCPSNRIPWQRYIDQWAAENDAEIDWLQALKKAVENEHEALRIIASNSWTKWRDLKALAERVA